MKCTFTFKPSANMLGRVVRLVQHELLTTGHHRCADSWYSYPVTDHRDPRVGTRYQQGLQELVLFNAGTQYSPISFATFQEEYYEELMESDPTGNGWQDAWEQHKDNCKSKFLQLGKLFAAIEGFFNGTLYEPYTDVMDRNNTAHWEYEDGLMIKEDRLKLWVTNSWINIQKLEDGLFEVLVGGKRTSLGQNQTGRMAHYLLNGEHLNGKVVTVESQAPLYDQTPSRLFRPTSLHRVVQALKADPWPNCAHGIMMHGGGNYSWQNPTPDLLIARLEDLIAQLKKSD